MYKNGFLGSAKIFFLLSLFSVSFSTALTNVRKQSHGKVVSIAVQLGIIGPARYAAPIAATILQRAAS
ncbi:MAG TPA: hypothetical protein VGN04_00725 [Herbaspirillum sp.]|jgi:hypothetical protein